MNTLDNQYLALLDRILEYGVEKSDRTGTGTLSVFGGQFIHDMKDGFPLLTTKRIAVKTMMTELKWFLKGDTNIKYLVDNGCNIWNGDAYKSYLKTAEERNYGDMTLSMEDFVETIKSNDAFANQFGELGPIYGSQWRQFGVWAPVDQMAELIDGLKNNPDSRRHIVTAWNPEDLYDVVLPPCHYGFQCYVADGELSLMWNQRSVDTFLGLPFNIASYATLLLLLCEETGYKPGRLIGNLGDIHIYKNHMDAVQEQLGRKHYPLPTIELSNVDILNGEFDYVLNDYQHGKTIKAPLSN